MLAGDDDVFVLDVCDEADVRIAELFPVAAGDINLTVMDAAETVLVVGGRLPAGLHHVAAVNVDRRLCQQPAVD